MIDPSTLESYGYGAEKIFANLEIRIMLDVARRIHDANVITRSADLQLYQLKLMGYSNADIRKLVESALGDSEAYVNSLYEEAIKTDYIRYKPMYEYMNKSFVPWIANVQLRNIVDQKRRNTINDYTNMTRSLGFVVNDGTGLKATRLTDYVNDKLNQCYVDIASGAFDYNTTLRKAVTEMTNSGVRWINYDTGWHNRITVAARRSIMSSLSDINSSISDQVAKDLNTDMFEVTAHANARPTHAVWQGGWYTKRELEEVCGLGDVTGLLGANCYHNYYPVIPGLSKHTYTKRELEEWKNDTPKEYGGKSYTGYEATQRMRKMETNMRAYRERIKILKESGGSETDILATQARYRAQMNEYARFSDAMGLKQQKERIYADGLGKVGNPFPDTRKLKDIHLPVSLGARWSNYDIYDSESDDYYHFIEGTHLQNIEVFAGKGVSKGLKYEVKEGLSKQFGGNPNDWQHVKGFGLIDFYGEPRHAEVHWFQNRDVGKIKFKVKEWLE